VSVLLITGGTGFFGKSFVDGFQRGLLDKWDIEKLIIISREGNISFDVKGECRNIQNYRQDVRKLEQLFDADYIIHAAAPTDIASYLNNGAEAEHIIKQGTENIINLIKRARTKSPLLYISSGAVYGENRTGMPQSESSETIDSISNYIINKKNYALWKLYAEQKIKNLGETTGVPVSIARCFSFVGRHLPLDGHYAIGNFIKQLKETGTIEVRSTIKVYRSYLGADDLVRWLMSILVNSSPDCPIYNVGSDYVLELRSFASVLAQGYGGKVLLPRETEGIADFYVPDISKIKKNLGVQVQENPLDIISRILQTNG
jgi:nucleoside-diphosphate-sugar epimerase